MCYDLCGLFNKRWKKIHVWVWGELIAKHKVGPLGSKLQSCVTGAHGQHLANCHVDWYESNIYFLISMTLLWPMSTDFDHSIIGIRKEFESWMSIKKHPKVPINWATRLLIIDDISNGHCNHDNNEYQC